ncbi:MAG TPA: hypothetical protein VNQ76_18300 [Planctomicrobium sp.]|nr:hypothetical protein [Planctomicrobium sp.]
MQFRTLIPTTFNDGTPIAADYVSNKAREFAILFGGSTVEGTMQGTWIDTTDGQIYLDEVVAISVVCENDQIEEARQAVIQIGRDLKQKAMFFEVRYYDGVQIIPIE